jgi:nicotinate phosphoribosyltransferase
VTWVDDANAALLTDLYELTMAAAYHAHGLDQPATFDLFIRRLPRARRFLVACGLEQALDYLERLRFDDAALRYLASLELFEPSFLDRLGELRFSGEVWAVPEGEIAFAEEPLLRVTAPLIEAQIVETFLLNVISFQTMVASKAARVALACQGRPFVDFSPRRDHGADAALKGARAAYVGGAAATSNVLAGQLFGLPVSGTMAHAFVMRFPTEVEAFRAYVRTFPGNAVLLVDTYDTEQGARHAVQVAQELAGQGIAVRAVRLDSGDLASLARSVRRILDDGGLEQVQIFASGDLDEHVIRELLEDRAPVDAFGVGTQLGTSGDAPSLGAVYKLAEDADGPKMKLARGKVTLPGRKQVFRRRSSGGAPVCDVIGVADESVEGEPLLERVLAGGERVAPSPSLGEARERCAEALRHLPQDLLRLDGADTEPYPVQLSPELAALTEGLEHRHVTVP